jgi:hypothetical protein
LARIIEADQVGIVDIAIAQGLDLSRLSRMDKLVGNCPKASQVVVAHVCGHVASVARFQRHWLGLVPRR